MSLAFHSRNIVAAGIVIQMIRSICAGIIIIISKRQGCWDFETQP